jgi:hypothetical protein
MGLAFSLQTMGSWTLANITSEEKKIDTSNRKASTSTIT